MKKISAILLCIVLLVTGAFSSFAVSAYLIHADSVQAKAGETVTIPVKISSNQGIMGFRITVSYDNKVFSAVKVNRGTVTDTGMFNDSIISSTQSSFDVLWSSTSNVKKDGVIFNIAMNVDSGVKSGEYTIDLSYNQSDTFNEKWQDVKLNTSSIKVSVINSDSKNPEDKPENNKNIFQKIADFFKRIIHFIKKIFSK